MQGLATIETRTEGQLTDDDKLRIGIAWDALSPNSRRAYQLAWRQLDEFLSAKGEALDNITDTQLAAYLSILDTQGMAPNTLSVNLAAVKWYFGNVKGQDVKFTISQKRLKSIRRDAKGRGLGQVDALVWADVERVCAFAEADRSIAGYRDSAMIRLMSDCLLRVSEVVAVNWRTVVTWLPRSFEITFIERPWQYKRTARVLCVCGFPRGVARVN